MRSAIRFGFIPVFLTLLASCSGDSTGPDPVDLSGSWSFSGNMTAAQQSISCSSMGTVSITQTGNTFSGSGQQQGTCSSPGGSIDNSGLLTITGGQISESQVSFQAPFCKYQGTIQGTNRMEGTSTCTIQEAGVTYNFSGTWQTSR